MTQLLFFSAIYLPREVISDTLGRILTPGNGGEFKITTPHNVVRPFSMLYHHVKQTKRVEQQAKRCGLEDHGDVRDNVQHANVQIYQ